MASFGIGAKLRQERVGQGLAIDDISRDTRIAHRFLEAIETDDFSCLPGLVFTRNFVRQYATALKLDPEPFLAELPKPDEFTAQLPKPPERNRSSYQRDRMVRTILVSSLWLLIVGGAGIAAWLRFSHPQRSDARHTSPVAAPEKAAPEKVSVLSAPVGVAALPTPANAQTEEAERPAPVRVSLTADEEAWVEVSADGKPAFTGVLKPNETREVSAAEQVKVSTGNAGGLRISLNGKPLESLGPHGQVRVVRLTAEGSRLLSKAPQPDAAPL